MKLKIIAIALICISLSGCEAFRYKKVDAKEFPPEPEKRVQKNMEEGRGFRLLGGKNGIGSTNYEFASSNPLWRATLDSLDFMPLASANYSGGIVITDWYTENSSPNESVKIEVRFLTNEIRSDAINIKVFFKECDNDLKNCKVNSSNNEIESSLKLKILKTAALYEKTAIEKNKKENPYIYNRPSKKEQN